MSDEQKPRHNGLRLHFGLRTLLFLVACLAVLFGGFRIGYDRGYRSGQEQKASETVVVVVYQVDDLVNSTPGKPSVNRLMEFITTTIAPHSWEAAGGIGRMALFHGDHQSLVITQTSEAHNEISELLAHLRANLANLPAKSRK